MARTDKDVPDWASAEWYEAYHGCREHGIFRYWQIGLARHSCDLPDEPKIEHQNAKSRTHCEWFPKVQTNPCGRAPKWYVDHVWTEPERVRVRDKLGETIKEYRANVDTENEFQNYHHRHSAKWLWS